MSAVIQKILFIEDDDSLRWLLKESFKNVEAEFVFASSMEDGKKEIDQFTFDLVICDYHLGDGIGTEVFKHLKQSNEDTPFILFTSISDILPELQTKSFHFVEKPELGILLGQAKSLLLESKKLPKRER